MHDDHAGDSFDDHRDRVLAAAVSSDGLSGATTARSGDVRIWELPCGSPDGRRCVAVSGVQRAPVTVAVSSGTGNRSLFTAGDSVVRWSFEAGSVEWRRVDTYLGGRIRSLAVDPDGRRVLAAVDGEGVRWWRTHDDEDRLLKPFGTPAAVAFGPDGLIIHGSGEGDVGCWSERNIEQYGHRPLWRFRARESASRRLLRVCDRGRLVISPRYGRVVVLSVEDGTEVAVFEAPARPTSIAVHPDAPLVVLGGRDGSLTWWDARSGRSLGRVQAHEGRVSALAMASGDLVLSGSGDGTVALWGMHGQRLLGRFDPAPASRPAVPYGQEDPWELGVTCGSPDGRTWLVGGHGGQVHILTWSESAGLVPVRAGRPRRTTEQIDVETLVDDLREHQDAGTGMAAAHFLNTPRAREYFQGPAGEGEWPHVVKALAALAVHGAGRTAREAAMITLGTADPSAAATAFYSMIDVHGTDPDGMAGRLRTYFTGEAEPTTESLIAALPDLDDSNNLLGVLTSQTLAERGAAAFPAVYDALRAFPIPAQKESETYWADETAKYHLLHVLAGMGTIATPAALTLARLRADGKMYRDTWHQAGEALEAIGSAAVVDVIATEILDRTEREGQGALRGFGCDSLLETLQAMPSAALAEARGLGAALAVVARCDDTRVQAMAKKIAATVDAYAAGPAGRYADRP